MQGKILVSASSEAQHGCVTKVVLSFGNAGLTIAVNPDTDEVEVRWLNPCQLASDPCRGLMTFVGQKLGWTWSARNDRGYRDAFLLSFEETVVPQVAFVGVAGELRIRLLSAQGG
nr:DUF6334 family protein [Parvularcula mediterranea]